MFDFPNAPVIDEIITTPEGIDYFWDGAKWAIVIGDFLPLVGGELTGPLSLTSAPQTWTFGVTDAAAVAPAIPGTFSITDTISGSERLQIYPGSGNPFIINANGSIEVGGPVISWVSYTGDGPAIYADAIRFTVLSDSTNSHFHWNFAHNLLSIASFYADGQINFTAWLNDTALLTLTSLNSSSEMSVITNNDQPASFQFGTATTHSTLSSFRWIWTAHPFASPIPNALILSANVGGATGTTTDRIVIHPAGDSLVQVQITEGGLAVVAPLPVAGAPGGSEDDATVSLASGAQAWELIAQSSGSSAPGAFTIGDATLGDRRFMIVPGAAGTLPITIGADGSVALGEPYLYFNGGSGDETGDSAFVHVDDYWMTFKLPDKPGFGDPDVGTPMGWRFVSGDNTEEVVIDQWGNIDTGAGGLTTYQVRFGTGGLWYGDGGVLTPSGDTMALYHAVYAPASYKEAYCITVGNYTPHPTIPPWGKGFNDYFAWTHRFGARKPVGFTGDDPHLGNSSVYGTWDAVSLNIYNAAYSDNLAYACGPANIPPPDTKPANWERACLGEWVSNVARYGTIKGGTGVSRDTAFLHGGLEMMRVRSNGLLVDNSVKVSNLLITDLTNYEYALCGEWVSNVARYGTMKGGTGSSRSSAFFYGGIEVMSIANASAFVVGSAQAANNQQLQIRGYRSGANYYNAVLSLGAPRSDTADLQSGIGRAALILPGNQVDVQARVFLSTNTANIVISGDADAIRTGNGGSLEVSSTGELSFWNVGFQTTRINRNRHDFYSFVVLHADPTSAMHAATKQYVDTQIALPLASVAELEARIAALEAQLAAQP